MFLIFFYFYVLFYIIFNVVFLFLLKINVQNYKYNAFLMGKLRLVLFRYVS